MKKKNLFLKYLTIFIGIVLLIFPILIFMLINTNKAENNIISIHKDRVIPLQQLNQISFNYSNDILRTITEATNKNISSDSAIYIIKKTAAENEKIWNRYLATYITPEERRLINKTEKVKKTVDIEISQIIHDLEVKKATLEKSSGKSHKINALVEILENSFNELITVQTIESDKLTSITTDVFKKMAMLLLFIALLCIVVIILLIKNYKLEKQLYYQAEELAEKNENLNIALEELDVANEELTTTNEELSSINEQLEHHKQHLENIVVVREKDLIKSEKKYRYIVDHAPIGIFQRNVPGDLIYYNNKILTFYECNSKEEFNEKYGDISDRWNEQSLHDTFLEELQKSKEVQGFINKVILKNGKTKWFSLYAYLDILESLINGFVLDITDQIEAEVAKKWSENRFKAIFEQSPIGIALVDDNGFPVLSNLQFSQMIGYSVDELKTMKFVEFTYPDDRETDLTLFNKLLKGDIPYYNIEKRYVNKNGQIVWANLNVTLLRNQNGKLEIIGMVSDITAQKAALLAVADNEKRFRLTATFSGNIIYEHHVLDDFIIWDGAIEKITGYSVSEMQSFDLKDWENMIHPDDRTEIINQLHKFLEKRGPFHTEYRLRTKNGEYVWIDDECFVFEESENRITKIIGVMKDISQSKTFERIILNSVIETEEQERLHFSQELHDGLGPLISSVKMYIQLLSLPGSDVKPEQIIGDIEKLIEESSRVIRDISFKLSPHILQNYGIVEALSTYIDRVKVSGKLDIGFNHEYVCRLSPIVETVVYRVICECINNTIKHAEAKNIFIDIKCFNSILTINYSDNGKGFDMEKIMQERKGIGLLNLQSRIKSINGNMSLKSSAEQGTSIIFKIEL